MIGERIKRARAAAGLSMQALGKQVGVSANMIKKYEHNISMPGSAMFIKLGKALGVRTEYFFRPINVNLSGVEYRKRSNTPAAVLKQIEADVLDQAERWQELANLWPAFPVPVFSGISGLPERMTTLEEVEQVAEHVRASWQLGLNPLPDLVDVLESHGVLVIITHVNDRTNSMGCKPRWLNSQSWWFLQIGRVTGSVLHWRMNWVTCCWIVGYLLT